MQNWQVALLVVSALLVGALIPLAWQAWQILRRFAALGERLEPVVADAGATAKRLERMTAGFEGREQSVSELAESMGELVTSLNRLRDTTRTATAVGAAVAAAVRAFRDLRADEGMEAPLADTQPTEAETVADVEPREDSTRRERGNGNAQRTEDYEREAVP